MTENFSGQSGAISGTWTGAGQLGSPGVLAEYQLPSRYRRPFLSRFFVACVFTGLFGLAVAEKPNPGLVTVACLVGIAAVYNGAVFIWRGRFRTRVTTQGIEIHGYFNHFVPWDDIKAVQEDGYGESQPLDAGYDVRSSPFGRRHSGAGTTTGRRARLGVVRIVRRRGKSMMLRAPLVTAWAPDPQFSEKLRQMQALSGQYGTRPLGS